MSRPRPVGDLTSPTRPGDDDNVGDDDTEPSPPVGLSPDLASSNDDDPNVVGGAAPPEPEPSIAAITPTRSFEEFYRREFPHIVALAQSLTGNRQLAEELAQEGFIAAHHRWRRIAGYDRPGDWVRRVVTNRAISGFRRRGAERRALARRGPDSEVTEAPTDNDQWLWDLVRTLPHRQAQAVALVYVEDLPLERVAAILGCAETTVKTHLHRGRQALARAIEAREHADHEIDVRATTGSARAASDRATSDRATSDRAPAGSLPDTARSAVAGHPVRRVAP